jgi:hypothetical protein
LISRTEKITTKAKAVIMPFVETSKVRNILPYNIDFVIPGFEKSYPEGIFKCLSFSNSSSEEWFLSFINEVENAIGKRYLPICRMSDGEFEFCVGYHYPRSASDEPICLYLLRTFQRIATRLRLKLFKKKFSAGGKGYVSGRYQYTELDSLRIRYIEQLMQISQHGFLSLHFTDRVKSHRRKQFQQQYIAPIIRWLGKQKIELNEENYYPFYFVYAMLTGPFRHRIYQNRRLLVVTSYNDAKRNAIIKGLEREGVADVQFIPLSQGRSMYDTIDLSTVKRPVDLVLVGGGIGASNILCQLEPLNTVAIDAGYIIECLADPERKKQRTFCWPDEERNGDYRPI